MAPEPKALLFALTSAHPSKPFDEFNKWYDERHAPSRAACPGVLNVRRYQLVKGGGRQEEDESPWPWLAMYELESADALQTEEYKNARKQDGNDESTMFDLLSRRVYTLVSDRKSEHYETALADGMRRYVGAIGAQLKTTSETDHQELHDYYEKDDSSGQKDSPWLRTAFWRLQDASDPRTWTKQAGVPQYMAVHEYAGNEDRRDVGAMKAGLSSEWPRNLFERLDFSMEERMLFEMWKQF